MVTRKDRKQLEKVARGCCKHFSRRHGGADDHTCLDLTRDIRHMCAPCRAKHYLANLANLAAFDR
jgi:hypothetical protein